MSQLEDIRKKIEAAHQYDQKIKKVVNNPEQMIKKIELLEQQNQKMAELLSFFQIENNVLKLNGNCHFVIAGNPGINLEGILRFRLSKEKLM